MKKKLLLFLSAANSAENIPVASTLAWLAKANNYLFDNYYDSYHKGIHFPGGDVRKLEQGLLTGGLVCGDRHFEEFYFLLHNFDVTVISMGESLFTSSIENLGVRSLGVFDRIDKLFRKVFDFFNLSEIPPVLMIGTRFAKDLKGVDAYLYPEIFYREAVGVSDCLSEEELLEICQENKKIHCLYVDKDKIAELDKLGFDVEEIDILQNNDSYFEITKRCALRWKDKAEGWLLGDPVLAAHWLPKACKEDLIPLYSIPQGKILSELGETIPVKGKVVYGRQFEDKDFFDLSRKNQCFQVIDPCRPPFQSVKHVDYSWHSSSKEKGFFDSEYSDEELMTFAQEGKILISLMLWSGMIREVENLHNLMDLIALTKLHCGLVLTAQSFEYMMHSPLELLTIPLGKGGVFPLVEPVLGSCGIGVGIESLLSTEQLRTFLEEGLARIEKKVENSACVPRGWWATMDADLEKLFWKEKPRLFRILKKPPYFQMRLKKKETGNHENADSDSEKNFNLKKNVLIQDVKKKMQTLGLGKYFSPYRPFEFYKPGNLRKDIADAVKSVGLEYMFTKSGFRSDPGIKHIDEDFIVLNYTAGQWDGWTPFETVNDVSDLKRSEKILLKRKKPGWIVSTIDSCLWAFSGEFWKKGSHLHDIALFCTQGGRSGKLINVKPYTIARYARIISRLE